MAKGWLDNYKNIPKAQEGIKSPNVWAQEQHFQEKNKEDKDYKKFIGNTGEEAIDIVQRFIPGLKYFPGLGSSFAVGEAEAYNQDASASDELGMIPFWPAQAASLMLLDAEVEKENMHKFAKNKYKGKDLTELVPEQEVNNKVIDKTYVPKPKIGKLKETKSKKVPYKEQREVNKVEIDNTRTNKPRVDTNYKPEPKPETEYKFTTPNISYRDDSFVMPEEFNDIKIDNTRVKKPKILKKENGGWLDNYNDSEVSLPEGFVGEGIFNGPKFDNPAWGGQFQMGGNLPGAVGNMYARTGSPSKGPRRNQTDVTDASAQNGKEMQYYQNGLDWKPKSISKNGAWLDNYEEAENGTKKEPAALATLRAIKEGKIKKENPYKNIKIKDERNEMVKSADNTKTAAKPKITDLNKLNVRNQTEKEKAAEKAYQDKAIAEQRKATREKANANPLNKGLGFFDSENQTRQNWEDSTAGLESKFRVSDTPNFFDDWINPLNQIGGMAADLGAAPNQIVQQDSMMPLITAIGVPLLTGGLEGIGAKTTKQFVSNLVNPLNIVPGYKSAERAIGQKLGNIRTSIAPELRQGLQTAGPSINNVEKKSIISNLNQAFAPLNPKNLKTQSGLDWMKQWYGHSDFARRYNPTGKYNSQSMQEHILDQLDQYQPKNYLDLLKDKGLKEYIDKSITSGGVSWGVPEEIYHNRTMYAPFNKKGLESVKTHELTHLIENNASHLSDMDQDTLLKPFGYDAKQIFGQDLPPHQLLGRRKAYHLEPTEIHARMNQARFELGLSPENKFTEEMFDNAMEMNEWNGMGKYIKDKKGFTDLMNNFWAVPPAVIGAGALQQSTQEEAPQYKQGGIIKDDRGQWDHPGEITEIGSNEITMEGVPYDVLGVSDTGDTKLMKPGKNYKFKGKKVTEYPMAKNGVNQQDQKTLQQLDQLTNFTNYNKPQPGGWLNKYN